MRPSVLLTIFTIRVHLNGAMYAKTLITSKLKELLGPKFRLKLPLSGAITIPNLIDYITYTAQSHTTAPPPQAR